MVFIADDLLYYYNDSRLIKMKGNDLAANSHKEIIIREMGGGGLMQSVIRVFINRMRG